MQAKADFTEIAERNGVEILRFAFPLVDSMSTEISGRCYIGLDCSRSRTTAEEQACIGHELGHCLYGGFYQGRLHLTLWSGMRFGQITGTSSRLFRAKRCLICSEKDMMRGKLQNGWTQRKSMYEGRTTITKTIGNVKKE